MLWYVCRFDSTNTNHMCLEDLKRLMESLGAPQTHVALKSMLKEVDEDKDMRINMREV
jgi:Ca2+-binding EF-hand superfamily protein